MLKLRVPLPIFCAWTAIVVVGIVSSYLPQVQWGYLHPRIFPSIYAGQNLWERLPGIFNRWDVLRYTHIALRGYEGQDPTYLAFFPGWPFLLRPLGWLVSNNEALLGLLALPINLFLWSFALFAWRDVMRLCGFFERYGAEASFQERRFLWVFALYPTALFNVVGYAESLLLLLAGLSLRSALEGRARSLFFLLPALCLVKQMGMFSGGAIVLWLFVYRRQGLPWAFAGYLLGVGMVLGYFAFLAGNPLAWVSVQSAWGRHFALPYAIFFHQKTKAFELYLYGAYLFIGPIWLVSYFRKASEKKSGAKFQQARCLALFYLGAILGPVWFGGSLQSIYRILYLVPFLIALPVTLFPPRPTRSWKLFLALLIVMSAHATYRYVAGLMIT